jgi:hypothetical protein
MDSISEIGLQNKTDAWLSLFMYLSKSLIARCGRQGEGVIREAVRRYGRDCGSKLLTAHKEAGLKTNLISLFNVGCLFACDPRTRRRIITENQQMRRWEVHICPKAHIWNKSGQSQIGRFYCEEMIHALVKAYTNGKGQANISQMLTDPANIRCLFAVYYRAANVDEAQRRESFDLDTGKQITAPEDTPGYSESIGRQWISIYYYLLETALERLGKEGLNAIATGLRNLAKHLSEMLKTQADNTKNSCDAVFVEENAPLKIAVDSDVFWNGYEQHDSKKIYAINFIGPLKAHLGLA